MIGWKGKSLKNVVCKLAWGSCVYNLWKQRNNVKFGTQPSSEEKTLQNKCWKVSSRVVGKGKFKACDVDVLL